MSIYAPTANSQKGKPQWSPKKTLCTGLKIANGCEKSSGFSLPTFPGSHSVTHVPCFPAQLFSGKTSLIFTIARSKFWCWCWWHQRPNHFCHARRLSPTESVSETESASESQSSPPLLSSRHSQFFFFLNSQRKLTGTYVARSSNDLVSVFKSPLLLTCCWLAPMAVFYFPEGGEQRCPEKRK